MDKTVYPLLCWQLDADTVFGILLGTGLERVDQNLKRLKTALSDQLQRLAESDDGLPEPEIDDARLKIVRVAVNLAYRTPKGSFPVPGAVEFTVAAVYGTDPDGGATKCWLPWLEESFYCYDEAQLPVMIEHHVRDRLNGMTPEAAQRFRMPSLPWLESLDARRIERAAFSAPVPRHLRDAHAGLEKLADRLPASGARRGLHVFPEAAWEQGALADAIAGRLLKGGNLLLIGEPGVGKTVVLTEAIRRAHRLAAPLDSPPTFWRTPVERLIGRAKYLGEWQAICDEAVDWLAMTRGVLWISDFSQLLQAGGADDAANSVAAYLLAPLRSGRLRLIGEMSPDELAVARERLPSFIDCFEALPLAEMDGSTARRVVDLFASHAQTAFGIRIDEPALDAGQRLLTRFVRYQRFPGKAVRFFGDLVREALAGQRSVVDELATIALFAKSTGLPEVFLRDDLALDDPAVHAFFAQRLVGQDAAIRQLKDIVYLFKAGLNDPNKPIATLLFAGPTGVGKTAAAKALANFFFGAGGGADPLLRIDMSEFQHAFQIERLIGSGSRPGKLVEHLRQRPFSVILLDEVEKADASVFDLLLAAFDEGRLRDSLGRVTDLRSSVIVMTTNLGVRRGAVPGFAQAGGQAGNGEEAELLNGIRKFFRPEFFNRIDRIVAFSPLSREAIETIARLELQALERREGLARRGLRLRFTPELVAHVATTGFSPTYGARPLQRLIEQQVVAALAKALFGDIEPGACLEVGIESGAVRVRPLPAEAVHGGGP